jgi:hypothetical protein
LHAYIPSSKGGRLPWVVAAGIPGKYQASWPSKQTQKAGTCG